MFVPEADINYPVSFYTPDHAVLENYDRFIVRKAQHKVSLEKSVNMPQRPKRSAQSIQAKYIVSRPDSGTNLHAAKVTFKGFANPHSSACCQKAITRVGRRRIRRRAWRA